MDSPSRKEFFTRLEGVLMDIGRRIHAELDAHMVSGITGSQFFVLKKIDAHGRMTVSEVADHLQVSLSAITALVDRLVQAGLVIRSRDEKDRRLVWLGATDKGKEILARCVEGRREVAAKYFGQLSDKDLEKLLEIFEKILARLKSEEKNK
ncbi:MAG: MarR family transcriptional regulator [Desulfotomaculaceae bacterium]|nr:MarR family transcriptional regulator [Desulfotomaculaceae bacterium]MDD4767026.1 MarR family transcriptional regulator [Desulfotomaculaceae bacterium]